MELEQGVMMAGEPAMSAPAELVRPCLGTTLLLEEIMRFLCLYTADHVSQPTPEHMAQMGKYVEQQFKAGKLVDTGGLKGREKDGSTVRLKGGEHIVNQGGAPWAAATGWAIITAPT